MESSGSKPNTEGFGGVGLELVRSVCIGMYCLDNVVLQRVQVADILFPSVTTDTCVTFLQLKQ